MTWITADHPYGVDERGRIATTTPDDHVRDMIRLLLFTSPGERVNRPDFGCGLLNLVFEPNGSALSITTQFLVQGSLQRWLGDVITVHDVRVRDNDGSLVVDVDYSLKEEGLRRQETFVAPGQGR